MKQYPYSFTYLALLVGLDRAIPLPSGGYAMANIAPVIHAG